MLNRFRTKFGFDIRTYRSQLEDAIIDKFGSIQYFKYDSYDQTPITYTVGTKFEWESNEIETKGEYYSIDEALAGLFIEQTRDIYEDEEIESYYNNVNREEFEEIIKHVRE